MNAALVTIEKFSRYQRLSSLSSDVYLINEKSEKVVGNHDLVTEIHHASIILLRYDLLGSDSPRAGGDEDNEGQPFPSIGHRKPVDVQQHVGVFAA